MKIIFNVCIGFMLVVVGYFAYAYMSRSTPASAPEKAQVPAVPAKVVQLDVLNGCGVKGAGAKFTAFLRANGFDVVEMKNYKTFNITHTMVVDRVGDLNAARKIATVLGVSEKNVIQQINPDYFVDVSVIIGEDYSTLRVSR
jgi:hypothetical protein